MIRRSIAAGLSLAAAVACAVPLSGQEAGEAEREDQTWEAQAELGASTFYGASDQTSFVFAAAASREEDHFKFSLTSAFTYGEAQSPNEPARVNQRSWGLGTEVDYRSGRWSPFLFVNGEGALVRQIDLRIAGGAGVGFTIFDTGSTTLDASLAVQGERTDPRTTDGTEGEIVTLARSNNRLRFAQKFGGDRAEFSQILFYKPALGDSEDYTLDSESALSFTLNSTLSFKVSLVNRYDNLAESRGAVSNNDGRLFFSILAKH